MKTDEVARKIEGPTSSTPKLAEVEGLRAALSGCAGTHNPHVFGDPTLREAWARGMRQVHAYRDRELKIQADSAMQQLAEARVENARLQESDQTRTTKNLHQDMIFLRSKRRFGRSFFGLCLLLKCYSIFKLIFPRINYDGDSSVSTKLYSRMEDYEFSR